VDIKIKHGQGMTITHAKANDPLEKWIIPHDRKELSFVITSWFTEQLLFSCLDFVELIDRVIWNGGKGCGWKRPWVGCVNVLSQHSPGGTDGSEKPEDVELNSLPPKYQA
jgi:hypothetical protein